MGPLENPMYKLAALIFVLTLLGLLTLHIVSVFGAQSTPVRIVISFLMLAPAGFFLGMPFPLAMRSATARYPALIPWFWGINGATSVCSSVLATAIAMSAGISAAYWTGYVFYLIAFVCFAAIVRKQAQHAPLLQEPELTVP